MLNTCVSRSTFAALMISSATLAGSLSAQQALAFEATDIINRYVEASKTMGQTFTYGSIKANGSDGFTVTDASWSIPDVPPIKAATVTFSGVKEQADGTVSIETISVPSIVADAGQVTVTIADSAMKNLRIPVKGETDLLKKLPLYASFATGKVDVVADGNSVFSAGSMLLTVSDFSATKPMETSAVVKDMAIDTTAIPEPQFQQMVQQLGYNGKFTGRIDMKGVWSLGDGNMNIDQYDIVLDNVGTISMPFSIGGYTLEKLEEINAFNEKAKDMTPAERAQASIAMFQDFSLNAFKFSFKDASLTERGLKVASTMMGQPPEQIAAGAPVMIGIGMGQLQMPELTQMVSQAVGKFLQKPGTISITVAPEKPLPFAEMGGMARNPKALVDALNVKVVAE